MDPDGRETSAARSGCAGKSQEFALILESFCFCSLLHQALCSGDASLLFAFDGR